MKREECCGCTACVNICPKNCIEMQEDKEGFLYPVFDKSQCIECGLCEKVCPFKDISSSNKDVLAYACANKDDRVRFDSSSGGIFSLLAEAIIFKGGKVYAAAFDDEGLVYHIYVDKVDEIHKVRGSKYVQSRLGTCFNDIKKSLMNNESVMFVGNPCQVKGLRKYLSKEYDNLLCVDFFCHGVPSPKVWKEYLNFLEKKMNNKICYNEKISFRNKIEGWSHYSLTIPFENNEEYRCRFGKDLYMQTFIRDYSLRPSCYECKCKPSKEISDITLADFWGIRNVLPEFYDDRGVSLIIINTEKGNKIFEDVTDKMVLQKVNYNDAIKYNKAAMHTVKKPSKRQYLFKNIGKKDMGKIMEYVLKDSWDARIKNFIWSLLNK